MKQISIIGGGWLGRPLATFLSTQSHSVKVSYRSDSTRDELTRLGIVASHFELGHPLTAELANCDLAVINLPPGRKGTDFQQFQQNMLTLISEFSAQSKIIFVSSTSVYGNTQGTVTENTPTAPSTESGRAHVEIEGVLLARGNATVLRLSGLIGPNRHPIRTLAGRQLANGSQRVNLIHLDDVIAAINLIIEKACWNERLHLSAPEHPTRADYYTQMAKQASLPIPEFSDYQGQQAKVIDSNQTLEKLALRLNYPDPYLMPIEI